MKRQERDALTKEVILCEIISICNEFPVLGGRYHIHKTMEWDIRVFESHKIVGWQLPDRLDVEVIYWLWKW